MLPSCFFICIANTTNLSRIWISIKLSNHNFSIPLQCQMNQLLTPPSLPKLFVLR